jgi:hypothetical protein
MEHVQGFSPDFCLTDKDKFPVVQAVVQSWKFNETAMHDWLFTFKPEEDEYYYIL